MAKILKSSDVKSYTAILAYSTLMSVIGICIIVYGVLVQLKESYLFNNLLSKAVRDFEKYRQDFPEELPEQYKNLNLKSYDYDNSVIGQTIVIVIIFCGVVVTITGAFGFFVRYWAGFKVLVVYTFIVCVEILTLIVTFCICIDFVYDDMKNSLKDYRGLSDDSLKGITWNALMVSNKCCGVNSFQDFQELENWPPQDLAGSTVDWMDPTKFEMPMACCKSFKDVPKGCHLKNSTHGVSWKKDGCYYKVALHIFEQWHIMSLATMFLLFMISFCVVLVVRICVLKMRVLCVMSSTTVPAGEMEDDDLQLCARQDPKLSVKFSSLIEETNEERGTTEPLSKSQISSTFTLQSKLKSSPIN